jgi:predicted kinase
VIISIAGTSGAGKTTLARELIAQAMAREDVKSDGKVIGAILQLPGKLDTFLVGRYEEGLQTCGCDTIKDVERVYTLVADMAAAGMNVVYEGLFVMNHTRGPELCWKARREGWNITVLHLTTPLDECFRSINARRAAQGEGPLENRKNTEGNFKRAQNYAYKMGLAGAKVYKVSRATALDRLMEALA